MIYADYSSTTPADLSVVEKAMPYFTAEFYNPSNVYSSSKNVKQEIEKAREIVARYIHAENDEVIFTSGGTESDNMAIIGVALHKENRKKHIIISEIEHKAVLDSAKYLEEHGFRVTRLNVDSVGRVAPETLLNAIDDDTFLVSVMYVNNEIGTVQEIESLAEIAHEHGALFHTDAVQAMTSQEIDVSASKIDLLTFSAHKIYSIKGAGVLYVKNGVKISPIIHGGQQEGYRRGGTENVPSIIALGRAVEILKEEREKHKENMTRWRKYLVEEFSKLDYVKIVSPIDGACSVLNVAFKDIEAEGLMFLLAREGIMVSMGSACNSKSVEPSHVIRAINLSECFARSCIRISLGRGLNDTLVEQLKEKIISMAESLRIS